MHVDSLLSLGHDSSAGNILFPALTHLQAAAGAITPKFVGFSDVEMNLLKDSRLSLSIS